MDRKEDLKDWRRQTIEAIEYERSLSSEIVVARDCFEQAVNSGSSIPEARAYAIEKFLSFNMDNPKGISHEELKKLDEVLYRASLDVSHSKKR